jgi:2,3-bisphosphoglycerate-independent phosphoglycerate mutase
VSALRYTASMRVVWLMLDGVGVMPQTDTAGNPFAHLELPVLQNLSIAMVKNHTESGGGHPHSRFVTRSLDANLGVAGLPQSGTGQTTILSGINAAKQLGFHHGPWVSPSLRPLLQDNILAKIGNVRLANFYPERYLASLESGKTRLNAIATAALSAGAKLEGEAGLGIAPMLHTPDQPTSPAQIRQWAIEFMNSSANITIFDQWWTDHLGHAMDLPAAQAFLYRLEQFCAVCLAHLDSDTLFLVTSDHGNFEDLTTKSHTRNPVPLAAVGQGAAHFAEANSLMDIAPALEKVFFVQ